MPDKSELLELAALFRSLFRSMTQEWNKEMSDHLSLSQVRMLYYLRNGESQKATALAELLCVTSGAVTGVADKLINRGLIERERAEDDRRVVYLRITDKGKQMIEMLMEKKTESISMFFESLLAEDIGHLKRILSQVLKRVENDEKE